MINLLPPQEKGALRFEQQKKLVIVLGNMVIICLLFLILMLLSVKFYILEDVRYRQGILDEIAKTNQGSDLNGFKNIIQDYNARMNTANDFYKNTNSVSVAINKILSLPRPAGLKITRIFVENNIGPVKISLAGLADTRDSLQVFKKSIETDKGIQNVYFPPESWVKPVNINFYITLEVDYE